MMVFEMNVLWLFVLLVVGVAWAPIIGAGANLAGQYFQNRSNKELTEAELKMQEYMARQQQQQFLMEFLARERSQGEDRKQTQAQGGLAATQMDPYAHAKALNGANVRRSYGQGISPNGTFTGQHDTSALNPENLQKNANYFYTQQAGVNPRGDLSDVNPVAEGRRLGLLENENSREAEFQKKLDAYLAQGSPTNPDTPLLTPEQQVEEWKRRYGPKRVGNFGKLF